MCLVIAKIKLCYFEALLSKIRLNSDTIRSEAMEYSLKLLLLWVIFVLLHFLTHADSDSHRHAALQGTVFVLLHFLTHVDSDSHRLQC